jgi:hypothetical protein
MTIRIPANIDQPDRLVAGLTGRQVAIIGTTALVLYGLWRPGGSCRPPRS